MEVKRNDNADDNPLIVIEGMEPIIQKDLDKHKAVLEQAQISLGVFRQAVSHEVKKKKYYKSLIGGKKYNDDSLRRSINDININIRHMSDKVALSQEKIAFETNIVDTLTKQLEDYRESINKLAKYRMKQAARDAINDRLGESVN